MKEIILLLAGIFILVKLEQNRQAGSRIAAPGAVTRGRSNGGSERSTDRGNGGTAESASFNPMGPGRTNGITGY